MPSILGAPEAHAIMAKRLVTPEFFDALLDEIAEWRLRQAKSEGRGRTVVV